MVNLFDTKDVEYIRKTITEFLEEEAEGNYVEILKNNKYFVSAKITKGRRFHFYLHYGAFRFKGKKFRLSIFGDSANIQIDGADLDLNNLELNGFLDCVRVDVDY